MQGRQRTEHLFAMKYQMLELTAADALISCDLTILQASKHDKADSDKQVCPKVQKSPETLQQCWQMAYTDCARYINNAQTFMQSALHSAQRGRVVDHIQAS